MMKQYITNLKKRCIFAVLDVQLRRRQLPFINFVYYVCRIDIDIAILSHRYSMEIEKVTSKHHYFKDVVVDFLNCYCDSIAYFL